MKPAPPVSRGEFSEVYRGGEETAWELVRRLQEEVAEYRRRLGMDSSNSSRPPSSDFAKGRPNNSRKPGGRTSGGQRGHRGATLAKVGIPDGTVLLIPESCGCGHCFDGSEERLSEESRQVIDVPEPTFTCTEYRAPALRCPRCNRRTRAAFPEEAKAPVQYGANLKSWVVYLVNHQLLPYKRCQELLRNCFGLSVSQGTIRNILGEFSRRAEKPVGQIKEQLMDSKVIHCDESGLYCKGGRHWLHVASNPLLCYYFHHRKRGVEAMLEAGVLPHYSGTVCHDYWKPYYKLEGVTHSLCNAHHLRDLQSLTDNDKLQWAGEMKTFLQAACHKVKQARKNGRNSLDETELEKLEAAYQAIIEQGYRQTAPPARSKKRGQPKKGKARNLLERFDLRRDEILDFCRDFSRPFDNNQAERDIRMIKVKQKISGTFRSPEMARAFCQTRSVISTLRKQSRDLFGALACLFKGIPLDLSPQPTT